MSFDGLLKGLSSPLGSLSMGLLANSRDPYGNVAPFGQALAGGMNTVYAQQLAQQQMQQRQAEQARQAAQQQWMAQNMPGMANAPQWAQKAQLEATMPGQQQMPEMIQQYNFAKGQGYGGTYMDFLREKKGPLVVNEIGGTQRSPAQTELDKAAAKTLAPYATGQGYDADKMIDQLNEVHSLLGSRDDLTGPMVGSLPLPAREIIAPESVNVQQQVEEVVQRNLRQILGAQFTQNEGDRLIARAYNPRLDEATNRKRLSRLIAQITAAHEAKKSALDYIQQNGSLDGWQGKMPTYEDFLTAVESDDTTQPQRRKWGRQSANN